MCVAKSNILLVFEEAISFLSKNEIELVNNIKFLARCHAIKPYLKYYTTVLLHINFLYVNSDAYWWVTISCMLCHIIMQIFK
jgi:hypothetical protein